MNEKSKPKLFVGLFNAALLFIIFGWVFLCCGIIVKEYEFYLASAVMNGAGMLIGFVFAREVNQA